MTREHCDNCEVVLTAENCAVPTMRSAQLRNGDLIVFMTSADYSVYPSKDDEHDPLVLCVTCYCELNQSAQLVGHDE